MILGFSFSFRLFTAERLHSQQARVEFGRFASLAVSYRPSLSVMLRITVVGIGGNGAEMKSFYQLKEEQEKRSDSTSGMYTYRFHTAGRKSEKSG